MTGLSHLCREEGCEEVFASASDLAEHAAEDHSSTPSSSRPSTRKEAPVAETFTCPEHPSAGPFATPHGLEIHRRRVRHAGGTPHPPRETPEVPTPRPKPKPKPETPESPAPRGRRRAPANGEVTLHVPRAQLERLVRAIGGSYVGAIDGTASPNALREASAFLELLADLKEALT